MTAMVMTLKTALARMNRSVAPAAYQYTVCPKLDLSPSPNHQTQACIAHCRPSHSKITTPYHLPNDGCYLKTKCQPSIPKVSTGTYSLQVLLMLWQATPPFKHLPIRMQCPLPLKVVFCQSCSVLRYCTTSGVTMTAMIMTPKTILACMNRSVTPAAYQYTVCPELDLSPSTNHQTQACIVHRRPSHS